MKLGDYKIVIVAAGLIGVLLFASPSLGLLVHVPGGEPFSELYVLGPDRLAENYPSNITVGQNYSVYLGVENHLGSSAYYVLYVKFGNLTDLLPNATSGAPSPLPALYEYRFSMRDGEGWLEPLIFSTTNASVDGNQSLINQLVINGQSFAVSKPAALDSNSTTLDYQLVFELWLYNSSTRAVEFNDRFVTLQLTLQRST